MTDENDHRSVGFLNAYGMTQPIIRGNACRQSLLGMRTSSKRNSKTDKRCRGAQHATAIGGHLGCHHWCPRPASVGDKAIGAAIIPGRLDAARNPVDAIDAAQQIGFLVRPGPKNPTRTPASLLRP